MADLKTKPTPTNETETERLRRENDELRAKLEARIKDELDSATDQDLPDPRKEWLGLSAQEKSQLAINAKYGTLRGKSDVTEFDVSIPGDRIQPTLRIPAHSELEAVAIYNETCGIRASDHPHNCRRANAAHSNAVSRV